MESLSQHIHNGWQSNWRGTGPSYPNSLASRCGSGSVRQMASRWAPSRTKPRYLHCCLLGWRLMSTFKRPSRLLRSPLHSSTRLELTFAAHITASCRGQLRRVRKDLIAKLQKLLGDESTRKLPVFPGGLELAMILRAHCQTSRISRPLCYTVRGQYGCPHVPDSKEIFLP